MDGSGSDNKSLIDGLGTTADNPKEIIWRGGIDENNTLEADNYPSTLYGKGRVNPTQNLVDAFPMANGYPITDTNSGYNAKDPYADRDPRLKAYILVNGDKIGSTDGVVNSAADSKTADGLNKENGKSTRTGYYLRKLLRSDINLNPNATTKQKHLNARIRSTEILLDYAEAANEAQGPKANVGGANYSAYDVIKAIRERAGIGEFGEDPYLEECAQTKDKMRELIRNRASPWNSASRIIVSGTCVAGMLISMRLPRVSTSQQTRQLVLSSIRPLMQRSVSMIDYMYYGPIPYSEILKYSNLKQNEGWK